jgi:hypothetical protein
MIPFSTQPPQEPALQQLGVEPIGLCPSMFPRNCHTRGIDNVLLYPTRLKATRQPKAVAAGPDRLVAPAMQQRKQPFWAWLQLLARLPLDAGKHAGTSQLEWLISMTAMIVLFWSTATRDLLKACPGAGGLSQKIGVMVRGCSKLCLC